MTRVGHLVPRRPRRGRFLRYGPKKLVQNALFLDLVAGRTDSPGTLYDVAKYLFPLMFNTLTHTLNNSKHYFNNFINN